MYSVVIVCKNLCNLPNNRLYFNLLQTGYRRYYLLSNSKNFYNSTTIEMGSIEQAKELAAKEAVDSHVKVSYRLYC